MNETPPTGPMVTAPASHRAQLRERASWALYDFANTIFSMNVATLYFSVWLIADLRAAALPTPMAGDLAWPVWVDDGDDEFLAGLFNSAEVLEHFGF